jgi:GNAT superfamily N-acetyltransferase
MDISIRPALATDELLMVEMLVAAAFWRPDGPSGLAQEVLQTPALAHYISGWPQHGDLGVIAQTDQPVGAAWLRFFTDSDPGYGFIETAIPEVYMGVVPVWRGRGVGRRLLNALVSAARDADIPALSLSVETDNHARRLYEEAGFQTDSEMNGAATMRLQL